MRRLIFIFLVTALPWYGYCQSKEVAAKIDSLIANARYDEAISIIQPLTQSGDPATAAVWLNRSAELTIMQGKLEEAEIALKKINSNGNSFVEGITKTNLGFLYLNKARNDLAMENLQQALTAFQESGHRNTLEEAKCLSNLALLYWSTGKLNQARENGLLALQIRQQIKGETSEEVAASYNDLGLVYAQSDADKALEYYEKALSTYQNIHGSDHPKIAIASTNIGVMYRQLKLYGDAVNNFENAESIWKKIYPEGHPNQALALVNLGLTYQEMGDKKASLEFFEKALDIYRKSYGEKHPDLSNVLNRIGILKLGEGQFDEAIQNFQGAICSNSPSFGQRDISKNPKVNEYYNGKVLLYSLRLKAQALETRYQNKTLRSSDIALALQCLHSCDTLIDDIRYHSSDENDKIDLGVSANEVYEDGVRIAHAMSENSVHFQKYRQIAFYFAEKSKSAVLQESIADAEAKSFAGIPNELLDEEKALKASIALLAQKLAQKPDEAEERNLREQEFTANRQYAGFITKLEKNYPDYYNLKFDRVTPSIPELQRVLDAKTAIVSYFIADKNQRLYTFIITRNKFRIYNSTLPTDFDKTVKGFNNCLYYTVPMSYNKSSNALSGLLLRGVPLSMKDLIIIPAGRLGTMPFEALSVNKLPPARDFANAHFLVQRVGISYEFSAGLLIQKSRTTRPQQQPSIFLCAPISFAEKDNLDDLPGTDNEVNNIAQLFASGALVARHNDANETLVKSGKLADYKYLHFATHGIVDETSPELSRIFLQPTSSEDGNVFSGEIFNLKLNADLAVLSACQTGLGKFSKGEGVIGLSRALVYAGARSIMVSYWSVADESTSQLMTDFYKALLLQPVPNFREALQQSKMKMISNGKYADPYYWAPFVLIGY
jgi:CHAT domain-containing protein